MLEACLITFKYMCGYQGVNLQIINTFSLALEKKFSFTIGCNDELTYISNANQ